MGETHGIRAAPGFQLLPPGDAFAQKPNVAERLTGQRTDTRAVVTALGPRIGTTGHRVAMPVAIACSQDH